jgi:PilZ domain
MTVRVVIKWRPEVPPPVVAAAANAFATANAKVGQPQPQIQRSHARVPVNYRFSIYANQPAAKDRSMTARGINMSKAGALVEAPYPISVGTVVYLKAPELGLMGEARVRHCTAKGSKFRIGLHFPDPLTRCL